MEKIHLFIPCFVDQFAPHVGRATLSVLETLGFDVDYPLSQTCCGQPLYNSGCQSDARKIVEKWRRDFRCAELPSSARPLVVSPSASCVSMLRNHAHGLGIDDLGCELFELSEFLFSRRDLLSLSGEFPHRVGLHIGCHGLRELHLAPCSEIPEVEGADPRPDKVRGVLEKLRGIEFVNLSRDECCGFGGSFAVTEPEISVGMGVDRLRDHLDAGVDYLVSTDWSCLMHLDGINRRQGYGLKMLHLAELLQIGMRGADV